LFVVTGAESYSRQHSW